MTAPSSAAGSTSQTLASTTSSRARREGATTSWPRLARRRRRQQSSGASRRRRTQLWRAAPALRGQRRTRWVGGWQGGWARGVVGGNWEGWHVYVWACPLSYAVLCRALGVSCARMCAAHLRVNGTTLGFDAPGHAPLTPCVRSCRSPFAPCLMPPDAIVGPHPAPAKLNGTQHSAHPQTSRTARAPFPHLYACNKYNAILLYAFLLLLQREKIIK